MTLLQKMLKGLKAMIRSILAGVIVKHGKYWPKSISWYSSSFQAQYDNAALNDTNLKGFDELKLSYPNSFHIHYDVISEEEEKNIISFITSMLKKKKYEGSHWDSVIINYKEIQVTEKNMPDSVSLTLNRCREIICQSLNYNYQFLPLHAIDLSAEGHIDAHVDSVKFSGDLIASLSLISDRSLILSPDKDKNLHSYKVLIPRRSLYILHGPMRYDYAHAILGKKHSMLSGEASIIERRISVMFRDVHPDDLI